MNRVELLEALRTTGKAMRAAQNAYFAAAKSNSFKGNEYRDARKLERAYDDIDRRLDELDAGGPRQRSLFGEEP